MLIQFVAIDTDASINNVYLDHLTSDNWVQVDTNLPRHCVQRENEILESVLNATKPNNEEEEGSVRMRRKHEKKDNLR